VIDIASGWHVSAGAFVSAGGRFCRPFGLERDRFAIIQNLRFDRSVGSLSGTTCHQVRSMGC
jgi:hypothetical protein